MKKLFSFFLIVVIGLSCNNEVEPLIIFGQKSTLRYDEEQWFILKIGEKPAPGDVNWAVSDNRVGDISSTGLFKARKVGECIIKATLDNAIAEMKLKITPYSTIIVEPFSKFGAKKTEVKSFEKRTLLTETPDMLTYAGDSKRVESVIYIFENDNLKSVSVSFALSAFNIEEVYKFYYERYPDYGLVDGLLRFYDDDKTRVIGPVSSEILNFKIKYAPYGTKL